ncbi:MAG: hypothetical protein EOM65_15840, partial [Synergistales bacterium]|nr:hypothetical protein [Synergistales bacterium]
MEITVTAPGRRFCADLENAAADRAFARIVGILTTAQSTKQEKKPTAMPIGGKARSIGQPTSAPVIVTVAEPVPATAGGEDPVPAAPEQAAPKREKADHIGTGAADSEGKDPGKLPERTKNGPWGFLFLKCEKCGEVRPFYTKDQLEVYRCRNCR